MKNRIIGDTLIPQFNGKSTPINLQDYADDDMPDIPGFEFLYIMPWDISQYTTKDDVYFNLRQWAIRYNDASPEAQGEMQDSYTRNDWDTTKGPPPQWTLDEDGNIDPEGAINGRRRVGGAIERQDATHIPIAVYKSIEGLSDLEEYQYRVEAAQTGNNMEGSVRYNGKIDYIMTGVDFIREGIINGDMNSIIDWLETRMNYKHRWPNTSSQKEIVNKIYEWGNAAYTITDQMTQPLADAWAKDNGFLKKINNKWDTNVHVVSVDDPRYADRLMADAIIPSVLPEKNKKRTDPVKIILYSKKRKPADVKKNILRFGRALDTAYENCFRMVEVMLDNGLTFNIPPYRPYKIEGCIPQLQDEQNVDGGKLIPYDVVTKNVTLK